jgi:hypothetical protein
MEPNDQVLDQQLSKSRHVSEIQLILQDTSCKSAVELDFFNNLKSRAAKFGIEVIQFNSQAKRREREADLPSM